MDDGFSLWAPSVPDDGPRALAAVFAIAALIFLARGLRGPAHRSLWLLAPLAAAALSAAYVVVYLRGGPRIIDATAYWLEARGFASGSLTLPVIGPEASVIGRFVARAPGGAAVIFPPGYPALLSLGFRLGAPLAVGPALAALLTLATMDLARLLPLEARLRGPAVSLVALLSVGCATLRYHTADTMAHGLAALCLTVAAAAALRAREARHFGPALALGLVVGLAFATRPVTALAALVLVPLARGRLGWVALAAAPGLLFWLVYQHAATGAPWLTAQHLYYQLSDGPPGCFRYGFGAVGCLGEHGDFVRARMPAGYGPLEALGTGARRLAMHAVDVIGFAPGYGLVVVGMICAFRTSARVLALVPLALVVAYAPFYFDGNYPGGGARMLADALPIEHALIALGLAHLAPERPAFARWAAATTAAGLAGFALHQGALHAHLRDREGGWPMIEAGAGEGMLFVATDHGFNLAFDPTLRRPVARYRGDLTDRLAWQAFGAPPAFLAASSQGPLGLEPMRFRDDRLEGESLWPALDQRGGWAWPAWRSEPCASGGRVLEVRPTEGVARVRLGLPSGLPRGHLTPRLDLENNAINQVHGAIAWLTLRAGGEAVHRWQIAPRSGCQELEAAVIPAGSEVELEVVTRAPLALDALLLTITH